MLQKFIENIEYFKNYVKYYIGAKEVAISGSDSVGVVGVDQTHSWLIPVTGLFTGSDTQSHQTRPNNFFFSSHVHAIMQGAVMRRKRTNLDLSGDGYPADLPTLERVNDATPPDIGVSNESDRYLLLIRIQLGELS